MEVIDSSDSDNSVQVISYGQSQKRSKMTKQFNRKKRHQNYSDHDFNEISDDESGLYTWCSIIVENGSFASRNQVLDTIIQNVQPYLLVPILCQKGDTVNKFYVCNSDQALKKLAEIGYMCVSDNFCFTLRVNENDTPFIPVDIKKTIDDVLQTQMTVGAGELDLSNFHNHPGLKDKIYVPLSFMANQVLVSSRVNALMLTADITSLNLKNNGLTDVKGFDMVKIFRNVTTLNLADNNLQNMRILFQCRDLDIKILHLDGNELCSKYPTASEFIIPVKMFFPDIEQLDYKCLSNNKTPLTIRNYSVDKNVTGLVDLFMETFYRLFDSDERGLLLQMYSDTSLLTIICNKKNTKLFRRRLSEICQGPRAIVNCLRSLPTIQHDPYSFSVDVPFATSTSVCIVISGALKLPTASLSEEEPVFDFTRTFILARNHDNRYKITNDMFHIFPLQTQYSDAFSVTKILKESLRLTPVSVTEATKTGLTGLLVNITELPEAEAVQCLEKVNWNFQNALRNTVDVLSRKLKE